MAESNPDSKSCSVCIDTYITPRMLPCGHSFCSGCLRRIFDAGCVNCPTCREPFPCHEIHRYPVNYALMALSQKTALKIANEIVSKKIANMEKTLKNCLIVDRAAVDLSAEQIFMLDTSRKRFFMFDFQLCLKHNFNFEAGEVLEFALNGDGTFYVSYDDGEQFMTSAVNKKDGLVLREIHSDKRSVGLLKAFNNNIFIVFVDELDQKQILMFTNEKLTKTIDLSKDIFSVHFVAPDYMLYRKSTKRNEFVVEKFGSTKTSEKCVETDDDNYASGSVWVPKKSSVESASGYLVISTFIEWVDLKVYDFDLATVRDGDGVTKLESVKISISSEEKCEQIYFYSSLGPETILCRLRMKTGDEKIAVLKLECN